MASVSEEYCAMEFERLLTVKTAAFRPAHDTIMASAKSTVFLDIVVWLISSNAAKARRGVSDENTKVCRYRLLLFDETMFLIDKRGYLSC
jgi:hypothetical protein